jgi:hypothetical protein
MFAFIDQLKKEVHEASQADRLRELLPECLVLI